MLLDERYDKIKTTPKGSDVYRTKERKKRCDPVGVECCSSDVMVYKHAMPSGL